MLHYALMFLIVGLIAGAPVVHVISGRRAPLP